MSGERPPPVRGQANLPALAVALLAVTAATGLALAMADGAFAGASRDADDRRIADAVAARLVAADSPLSTRANVLDGPRIEEVTASTLRERYPVLRGVAFRISLEDRTLAERGAPDGGATRRRVVLVERRQRVTISPRLHGGEVTLPRRAAAAELAVDAPPATTLRTVRANDRVLLADPSGLNGSFDVRLSRFETTTLSFAADGPLPPGSVEVTYAPARTTKARLVVTVDA